MAAQKAEAQRRLLRPSKKYDAAGEQGAGRRGNAERKKQLVSIRWGKGEGRRRGQRVGRRRGGGAGRRGNAERKKQLVSQTVGGGGGAAPGSRVAPGSRYCLRARWHLRGLQETGWRGKCRTQKYSS